jgi:hypothetical protein
MPAAPSRWSIERETPEHVQFDIAARGCEVWSGARKKKKHRSVKCGCKKASDNSCDEDLGEEENWIRTGTLADNGASEGDVIKCWDPQPSRSPHDDETTPP